MSSSAATRWPDYGPRVPTAKMWFVDDTSTTSSGWPNRGLTMPRSSASLHRSHPLMAENANLDAARRWAVERGDAGGALRLIQALDLFWPYAIPPRPRRLERLAPVLALPFDRDDQTVLLNRAWACCAAGQLTMKEPPHARQWFEESRAHFRFSGMREVRRLRCGDWWRPR